MVKTGAAALGAVTIGTLTGNASAAGKIPEQQRPAEDQIAKILGAESAEGKIREILDRFIDGIEGIFSRDKTLAPEKLPENIVAKINKLTSMYLNEYVKTFNIPEDSRTAALDVQALTFAIFNAQEREKEHRVIDSLKNIWYEASILDVQESYGTEPALDTTMPDRKI